MDNLDPDLIEKAGIEIAQGEQSELEQRLEYTRAQAISVIEERDSKPMSDGAVEIMLETDEGYQKVLKLVEAKRTEVRDLIRELQEKVDKRNNE